MQRDVKCLWENKFDVCIIGGGIYGACAAWDAALRGLSVALVEKADFASATSFNSQNTIHGGFRYLQNMDIPRVRSAVKERRAWMTMAPHLVHPLPFLIPLYDKLSKPKSLFYIAFRMYDLLSPDRNKTADPQKHIPPGRIVSIQKCHELFNEIEDDRDLTGGALFYDALIHNPGRLCLGFLQSAAEKGAVIANYAEARGFRHGSGKITGLEVRDLLGEIDFIVKAKVFLNLSGPWVNRTLSALKGYAANPVELVKVMYLVARRPLVRSAIGLLGDKGKYYFMLPWHGHSLIGIAELPFEQSDLDKVTISEEAVESFISDINRLRPSINLRRKDVVAVRKGLLPANEIKGTLKDSQLATKAKVIDHKKDGLDNLISVVGIKFTMARSIAQHIVDLAFLKLGHTPKPCSTQFTRLHGGQIEYFDKFLSDAINRHHHFLPPYNIKHLVLNYGSEYEEILKYLNPDSAYQGQAVDDASVLRAETMYAIHEEMAQKLSDIVFRRTDLCLTGIPGEGSLSVCADIAANEMKWSQSRKKEEIEYVKAAFSW